MPTHKMAQNELEDLLRGIRDGDENAAKALVSRYEPYVRRVVRERLKSDKLRRLFDSLDICQDVYLKLFRGLNEGAFHIESPERLGALLAKIAKNSLNSHVTNSSAAKRDLGRTTSDPQAVEELTDRQSTPSKVISAKEQLERLPADLQGVALERAAGMTWKEIGESRGVDAEKLRSRLRRASEDDH